MKTSVHGTFGTDPPLGASPCTRHPVMLPFSQPDAAHSAHPTNIFFEAVDPFLNSQACLPSRTTSTRTHFLLRKANSFFDAFVRCTHTRQRCGLFALEPDQLALPRSQTVRRHILQPLTRTARSSSLAGLGSFLCAECAAEQPSWRTTCTEKRRVAIGVVLAGLRPAIWRAAHAVHRQQALRRGRGGAARRNRAFRITLRVIFSLTGISGYCSYR